MKIAFVGKGGSGKTTMASLFAQYAARRGQRVLALDADINQHLSGALGYHGRLRSMGLEFDDIKRQLRGSNGRFTLQQMKKTTPPGTGSELVTLDEDDWFIKNYTQTANEVMVAGAGDIPDGNVGVRCFHGLNGAAELVLGHMIDTPDDTVIIDMTAGADAFSSSLFAKVDALVLVVEPTMKSLSVYDQFEPHVKEYDVPLLVVGNKVIDQDDEVFIKNRVGTLAAVIGSSSFIRRRDRGDDVPFDQIEPQLEQQLKLIADAARQVSRDWDLLERRSHRLHRKNAADWMGADAVDQIDPTFSLKKAAQIYGC